MNVVTEYPLWFLIFCISAGLFYAFFLYHNDKKFLETTRIIVYLLATFRFIVITILSYLLLSPLIKNIEREVEKPIIVIAQDDSESILANNDSTFYKKDYISKLESLVNSLKDKYDVQLYSFGDKIKNANSFDSIKFNEKQTNVSSLLEEFTNIYSNRNVGAIIIASDGIYNAGSNPIYTSKSINVPIYTLALGDTTVRKDVILKDVNHNRLAYLGNKFPLEIIINAKQLKGKTSILTVSKGDQKLFAQPININSEAFIQTVPVLLESTNVGLQHYTITLSSIEGEITLLNNSKDIFIDVLDAREKILILSEAPHPDVSAIKEAILSNQNYEVESYVFKDFDKSIKKYNLVILHQVSLSKNKSSALLSDLSSRAVPIWYFSGANQLIKNDIFNSTIVSKTNEVEPVLEVKFPLFTLSEEFRSKFKNLPAISSPFGTISNISVNNILFYQRIGVVDTKVPLMLFDNTNSNKLAVFNGEGIWKWRLYDFAVNSNHEMFNEFISKTIQYLSVKEDKSFFRVTGANRFLENEKIVLNAEVYNESYELINEPEVNLIITNSDNKNFSYSFSKTSNAYKVDAGNFPVGDYKYIAKTKVGDKIYSYANKFSVLPMQLELTNLIANHQLLYNLSSKKGGKMYYPKEMQKILNEIINREDIKSVSYSQNKLSDMINLKWIFFLIISILSIEWFFRKRNGAY